MGEYFNVKRVMDGVYHISDPINDPATVCRTLVVGTEKALLFDTGYGIGDLRKLIASITNLPIIVVNSHGHIDHVSGNYQFSEVYIHPEDIPIQKKYMIREVKDYVVGYFKQRNLIFPENFGKEDYVNNEDKAVLIPLEEGKVFDLGGREHINRYLH